MLTRIDRVEEKINELKKQTDFYVHEMKKAIEELIVPESVNVISYFTSSINISYNPDEESLCLGSYHIRNIGTQPITNPSLCIKLPEDSPFSFSGRYVYEHFAPNLKGNSSWERINDQSSKEEFWLRPIGKTTLEPNETLSFPNFQIKWGNNSSYSGSIMGFTYSDQFEDGIVVLNPINLNGMSYTQEDENE
ncbi:hypothetical protein ABE61_16070 [Lysinibacillus sphaericus]|uniref:hypothetical protein n=1 Tax=Lysinibacillus sphaericus TaxID=1421 RepID=UPI0018CF7337|nr:hypothetical protein [Lysinibacillus sphaericus]MBG9455541.1 hypothetical protein [Lysinibacillus sphaericus]MBG9477958.1 hypothetical protein [Lysinibacillus sphaericus]MBG9594098.1 hypothetical protein [Lysinibacillus sphaericus]